MWLWSEWQWGQTITKNEINKTIGWVCVVAQIFITGDHGVVVEIAIRRDKSKEYRTWYCWLSRWMALPNLIKYPMGSHAHLIKGLVNSFRRQVPLENKTYFSCSYNLSRLRICWQFLWSKEQSYLYCVLENAKEIHFLWKHIFFPTITW